MSNTAEQFAKIYSAKLANLKIALSRIARDIGNEALLYFMEQFKKGQDPNGRPWQPRKDGDNSRALLVKSGRLRRSIRLTRVTKKSARIGSNVPCAQYHNEGAGRLPKRQFLGHSAELKRRVQRLIRRKIDEALA